MRVYLATALFAGLLAPLTLGGESKQGKKDPKDRHKAVDRLSDLGAFMKQYDKDNDGKIERDELPEHMRSGFKRIDRNKDGKLDRGELRAHARRMRQGGRPVEVIYFWVIEAQRNTPTLQDLQEAYDFLRKVDRDKDGKITSEDIADLRDKLLDERLDCIMKELDSDQDGKISRDETNGTLLEEHFERLNDNDDGFLTREELRMGLHGERPDSSQKSDKKR